MQTDYKQIYKELSESTGENEQMFKDLGNFVFAQAYSMMRNPKSLIIKLKGVGSWHLRKKRMEIVVTQWSDRGLVRLREEFESEGMWNEYVEKKKQYDIFVERLKEYEIYLKEKAEINKKRRETQYLLTPKEDITKFKSE